MNNRAMLHIVADQQFFEEAPAFWRGANAKSSGARKIMGPKRQRCGFNAQFPEIFFFDKISCLRFRGRNPRPLNISLITYSASVPVSRL